MTDDRTPALTPDLWNEIKDGIEALEVLPTTKGGMLVAMAPRPLGKHGRRAVTIENISEERHAAAALCLFQQEFGFTHEDVAFLRFEAEHARKNHGPLIAGSFDFDALADRIAALLPPAK